jgi:acyl-coenzyme A synthetase/AMP-(fatty) acid ligase
MLYPRWLEIARLHADRPAVIDGETGRSWTFAWLAEEVDARSPADAPRVARTGTAGFFVDVLHAWRDGQAVIPVERDAPEPRLHSVPPPDIRLVKHTPGAAGIPRGIFFDDTRVIADADRIAAAMGLTPATPNLAVVSLAHSYGFSNVVLPLLLHGVPVHLVAAPFPRVVADACRAHEAVALPAVPSMWRAWHRSGILPGLPIALAVSAGAPLALELERDVFSSAGLKIHNFYGASECGGISFDATDRPRESADDAGTPLPGVRVTIDPGGRLRVASDAVAAGYDEPRDADPLGDGVYLTHDLGQLDETGRLRLFGTTGGAINVAGRKISPAKVEAALLATGLVTRVRVSGQPSPDPERVEEIAARVELAAGITLAQLKQAALDRLANWEVPRHWQEGR